MSVIPTGQPSHTRTADIDVYGGHVNKRNHLSQGVVDPETDVGAEDFSRMVADLAAAVRVIPFSVLRFTCNDTSPAAPSVSSVLQQTGVNSAGYEGDDPPDGFPELARNGDGDVTITWEASYDDPYGVSGALSILMASGSITNLSSPGHVVVEMVSGTEVRVRAFDEDGLAVDDAEIALQVW